MMMSTSLEISVGFFFFFFFINCFLGCAGWVFVAVCLSLVVEDQCFFFISCFLGCAGSLWQCALSLIMEKISVFFFINCFLEFFRVFVAVCLS